MISISLDKPTLLVLNFEVKKPVTLSITGFSPYKNSVYFRRTPEMLVKSGALEFPLPIVHSRILLSIRAIEGSLPSDFRLVSIEKKKLLLPKLSGFEKEFASLAHFVAKHGGYCRRGVHYSPNKEIKLVWMPRLYAIDQNGQRVNGFINEVARTDINSPYMEVSDLIRKYTIAQKYFVMCHEIAHYLTNSLDELACDRVALDLYKKGGFPDSEAYYALADILTDKPESNARIAQMMQLLSK